MSRILAAEAKEFMGRFGLRAKKSLGQHFLVDEHVLQRILKAARLDPADTVVEVGPGLGILTRDLSRQVARVIAVEADAGLASALRQVTENAANVTIIESDILQTDLAAVLASAGVSGGTPGYKIVANIPYYITSRFFRHVLESPAKPSLIVVTVQKEVGEAITAGAGHMSLLAVSVQLYGKPEIVGQVPARSFRPAPKVDSVILRIELHQEPAVRLTDTTAFFAVVRAGFSAPRKQLRNSLAQGLGISPPEAKAYLERAMIDPRRRAEALELEEWARLCQEVGGNETEVCARL